MIERWVYIVGVPTPLLDDPDFWKWINEPDENEDEMDDRKLSDDDLSDYRAIFADVKNGHLEQTHDAAVYRAPRLLDHIEAMEAEQTALGQFVKTMEEAVREANHSHHLSTNWVTAEIEKALDQLRKANGPG